MHTGQVLQWLIGKTGVSLEQLAKEVGITPEHLQKILTGEEKPTQKTIYKTARFFRVPPAYLALGVIPKYYEVEKYVKDFRGRTSKPLSVNARALVSHLYRIIETYRVAFNASRKPFVGTFKEIYQKAIKDNQLGKLMQPLSRKVSKLLNIAELQAASKNERDLYVRLLNHFSKLGVNVVESSTVGNHTKWVIPEGDFEGLAIADPYLPTIFVHSRIATTPGRRVFTMVHEFVHIVLGISALDFPLNSVSQHEKWINQVTAEILIPEEKFSQLWEQISPKTGDIEGIIKKLKNYFHVSAEALYYRAFQMKYIPHQAYEEVHKKAMEKIQKMREHSTAASGGPSFWKLLPGRFGYFYVQEIMKAIHADKLSIHEGAEYMGIHTITLYKYVEQTEAETV